MISILTEPKFPKTALGIERESITAVELVRESGRFTVRRASTIELPPGLVSPSFTEKNISDPAQFRHFLGEALTVSGVLDQRAWSVSLPGSTARCAILSFDKTALEKGSYDEIIDWKAEQSFGAPAVELRIQREKIAAEDRRVRFFATAVKLSVLDEYESAFESLGLKAGLIIPRALSELKWLYSGSSFVASLLISSQEDGFTALLLHEGQPAVVLA
jgi:Tfp pilus assembly PilM family ATPase